jgi:DNA invertase Pin-like site-specific DNA recombinase
MLEYCEKHGIDVIVFEDASRLARDLIVQEVAYQRLVEDGGYILISAASPDQFQEAGMTADLVRQILGAVAQFERGQVVERLRQGREKKALTATERTLQGRGRSCGVRSRLNGPDGATIRRALSEFVERHALREGGISAAVATLTAAGILTRDANEVSHGQATTWIKALKAWAVSAPSGGTL